MVHITWMYKSRQERFYLAHKLSSFSCSYNRTSFSVGSKSHFSLQLLFEKRCKRWHLDLTVRETLRPSILQAFIFRYIVADYEREVNEKRHISPFFFVPGDVQAKRYKKTRKKSSKATPNQPLRNNTCQVTITIRSGCIQPTPRLLFVQRRERHKRDKDAEIQWSSKHTIVHLSLNRDKRGRKIFLKFTNLEDAMASATIHEQHIRRSYLPNTNSFH